MNALLILFVIVMFVIGNFWAVVVPAVFIAVAMHPYRRTEKKD